MNSEFVFVCSVAEQSFFALFYLPLCVLSLLQGVDLPNGNADTCILFKFKSLVPLSGSLSQTLGI